MRVRDPVELVLSMSEEEHRDWLRSLTPDDAADPIRNAPAHEHLSLLAMLDPRPRAEVSALLACKEDEAGGLMNPRFARQFRLAGHDAGYSRHGARGSAARTMVAGSRGR